MPYDEIFGPKAAEKAKAKPVKKQSKALIPKSELSDIDYLEDLVSSALMEVSTMQVTQVASPGFDFRSSSLPFCPIRTFLREPRSENYAMTHYTTIGTAMHLTIQSYLALTKISSRHMYGSWKCTSCGKLLLNRKRPSQPCECTGLSSTTEFHRRWPKFWMYEEVEFTYLGLSGHIDLILWPTPDKAYVVDFKSTDLTKKKASFWFKPDEPSSPSYIAQIRTYCTVMEKAHNLPIKGWCLANLDRSQPIKKPDDFHLLPSTWNTTKTERWDKWLQKAARNNKRLRRLENAIDEGNRQDAKKYLNAIIEYRPCVSDKTYKAWMAYSFFGKTECERKADCLSCNHKKILTGIQKTLAEKT